MTLPSRGDGSDCIVVSGAATVSAEPDVAYIHLGVIAQAKTAKAAMTEANKKANPFMAKMKQQLGSNGKIETSTINFQPVYARSRVENIVEQEVVAYKAVHYFDIETGDLASAGEIIDTALADGLNTFRNVRFGLRDDRDVRKQALAAAVADARAKADVIADAASLSIVGVCEIAESPSSRHMALTLGTRARGMGETTMEPGEIAVGCSVIVRYRVVPR